MDGAGLVTRPKGSLQESSPFMRFLLVVVVVDRSSVNEKGKK